MSDREPSPAPAPAPTPQQKSETMDAEVPLKEESPSLPSPSAGIANSKAPSSSPGKAPRSTAAQRRAALRDDPLVGEVEPHRVHCRACQKWIKLSPHIVYGLSNWKSHKLRCVSSSASLRSLRRTPTKPSFSPDSRVATAERQIVLLNDPQVKTFSTGHVCCGTCKTLVGLEGEVDYDLTRWIEHKKNCIPMTPAPITPQGCQPRTFPPPSTSSTHFHVSAGGSARSPTPAGEGSNSQSTETTAVPESSPPSVKIGVKRERDEETGDGEDVVKDERPTIRLRTETYKPPEKNTPSLFGWLAQPFREFARGFREGLGST